MISLIAAKSRNNVIGNNGALPWRLPADLARFRKLTAGHPAVMGRKTYESIVDVLGGPLPNRTNVLVTRDGESIAHHANVIVVHSIDDALVHAQQIDTEVWVIGGGEIYRQTLPFADRLYITEVDTECEGDAYFPDYTLADWKEISREEHMADEENEFNYTFVVLERIR